MINLTFDSLMFVIVEYSFFDFWCEVPLTFVSAQTYEVGLVSQ